MNRERTQVRYVRMRLGPLARDNSRQRGVVQQVWLRPHDLLEKVVRAARPIGRCQRVGDD